MSYNITGNSFYTNHLRNVPGPTQQRPLAVGSPIVVKGYGWGIITNVGYIQGGITYGEAIAPGTRILSVLFPNQKMPIDIAVTVLTYNSQFSGEVTPLQEQN
jgi:hypothetical protein